MQKLERSSSLDTIFNYQKIRKPDLHQDCILISLDGSIGVGKSTLLSHIRKHYSKLCDITSEPVAEWQNFHGVNLLSKFYNNQRKYAFTFQSVALLSLVERLVEKCDKKFRFIERSPFTTIDIFARMLRNGKRINKDSFNSLCDLFYWFAKHYEKQIIPSVIIYISSTPELCYRRILQRQRKEEMHRIHVNYLHTLHIEYSRMIQSLSGPDSSQIIFTIDGSQTIEQIQDDFDGRIWPALQTLFFK